MRLLGALAFGIFVFYLVGRMTGHTPMLRLGLGRSRRPDVDDRQLWLRQAGLELTPTQYYTGLSVVGIATFAIFTVITATPAVAMVPAAIAVALPHSFFGRRRLKNMSKTQKAWPDAIREVISSLESNSSLHGALVQLSYRGPEALREAFNRYPTHASTVGVVPALEAVRERLADPTSDRVIEVLILAHERGGAIVGDIMRDLAHNTQEDLQLQEEVETAQLEQKINGRAVFLLPWAVLILLVVGNDDFRAFYRSGWGTGVVIIGAALSLLGMYILSRLGREKPEQRVFGGSAVPITHVPLGEA
jgi:tight adherence protein B